MSRNAGDGGGQSSTRMQRRRGLGGTGQWRGGEGGGIVAWDGEEEGGIKRGGGGVWNEYWEDSAEVFWDTGYDYGFLFGCKGTFILSVGLSTTVLPYHHTTYLIVDSNIRHAA